MLAPEIVFLSIRFAYYYCTLLVDYNTCYRLSLSVISHQSDRLRLLLSSE